MDQRANDNGRKTGRVRQSQPREKHLFLRLGEQTYLLCHQADRCPSALDRSAHPLQMSQILQATVLPVY